MSQLIQHYQTSFVIRGGTYDAAIKLYQAQHLTRSWIEGIENKRFKKFHRDPNASFVFKYAKKGNDFRRRSYFRSDHSWCKTDFFTGEKSLAWTVEYTHRDSVERNVFWVTEIGLHGFSQDNSLVVNVRNCYKLSTEFALTGKEYAPVTSIPKIVELILATFDDCQFYSGDVDVTVSLKEAVLVDTAEHATKVVNYIKNMDRKLAVVLIGGESEKAKAEALLLSRNLFGKALVHLVSFNHNVVRALRPIRLEFDECCILPTWRGCDSEVSNNLRYRISETSLSERHKLLFKAWLGYHPIYEHGAVATIQDVRRLILLEQLKSFSDELRQRVPTAEYAELESRFSEVSEYLKIYEEENQDLRKEKNDLQHEKDDLKKAKDDIEFSKLEMEDKHKEELRSQKEKLQGQLRKRMSISELPRKLPLEIDDLRKWSDYFTNLIIPDKAWNGMSSRRQVEFVLTAWDMLWCLNKIVFDFYSSDMNGVPSEVITNGTGYEFSANESSSTKNNVEWSREREVTIGKKTYTCYKHLKKSNGAANAMRVYFDYDPELNRIVVAHIGEHLTTRGTSRT